MPRVPPLIEATSAEAAARGQGIAPTYVRWAVAIVNKRPLPLLLQSGRGSPADVESDTGARVK
jgi:hypothetical protein